MAATWDSAYCLDLLNRLTMRPTADEITDATKYKWLTEAQTQVVADIAARCPWVLYGAPATLSTADSGKTFTFGTDTNGYALFPEGNVRIFSSLTAIPDSPWREGDDYLSEGTQIRIPNNRTFAGTLYWRGITPPIDIDATHQPSLMPPASRRLICLKAAEQFQRALGRPDLAADYRTEYDDDELPRWLLVWRRQFSSGGALLSRSGLVQAELGSAGGAA